ncbi:retrotransposon protein, putative, ty1-copia subclass [Tanacetum coccineum]
MGNTIGELHAMLIEYEKGLPKKAETPQVMMIKGGKIQKSNKKSLKAKGKGKANGKGKDKQVYIPKPKNPKPSAKEHPAKDDTCHHCKEVGHCKRNYPAYLAELIKKKKQVGIASSSDVFIIELFSFPTKSWVYDTSCGTHICNTKHGLGGVRKLKQVEAIGSFDLVLPNGLVICLDNCHYAPSITRGVVSVHRLTIKAIQSDRGGEYISQEFKDYLKANGIVQQLTPPYTPQHNGVFERRNRTLLDMGYEALVKRDTPDKLKQRSVKCIAEILRDTTPSEITSNIPQEVEGFEPPQEEVICRIRRSERTRRAPNRLCLNVEVEEHSLGDLNEPTSYTAQCAQTPKEVNRMKNVPYASAVGSIMYAVRCTRPDVAFAQNMTSRFQQNPGELHWTAVKNILKYLRNTKDMFLVYGENPEAELRVV